MWVRFAFILLATSAIAGRTGGGGGHGGYGRGGHSSYGHSSHSYPHSTGLSGNSAGTHTGVYTGTHTGVYTGTSSGNVHTYPQSHGLSGTGGGATHTNVHTASATNVVHDNRKVEHHYHYHPPQQIMYGSVSHPVYVGTPPVYIHEYRESGSRFDNLLTGLALYNLGRMSASHHHSGYNSYDTYHSNPGEVCKLKVVKGVGNFEETRIDCKIIASFIYDAQSEQNKVKTTNVVTTTVTNHTVLNTNGVINGDGTHSNGTSVTSIVTVENKTVVDALQVKGPSINVTPGMKCYMSRAARDYSFSKEIDCGLLQMYAEKSYRSEATHVLPIVTLLITTITIICIV